MNADLRTLIRQHRSTITRQRVHTELALAGLCRHCEKPIPPRRGPKALYCDNQCRKNHWDAGR